MGSRLLMTLQVAVVGAQRIGPVPYGTRVVAPIGGGQFQGPRLQGNVLPGRFSEQTASSSSTCASHSKQTTAR